MLQVCAVSDTLMPNLLSNIQKYLEAIYEISVPQNIDDFVIHDKRMVELLSNQSIDENALEQLLISSHEDCLDVSLYLDFDLMERLGEKLPSLKTNKNDLHDFWVALEGVSHFLYLVWNANYDRPVSQLELELQAEVDKFVSATAILGLEKDNVFMQEIWALLFSQPKFKDKLEREKLLRYQKANAYASQYCLSLMEMQHKTTKCLHNELRRFYRLNQQAKISRIDNLNSTIKQ